MRSATDKKVAGVCAGLANYFGMDVTLMRILWLAGIFYTVGTGLLIYLLCWVVMPIEPVRVYSSSPFTERPIST